MLEELANRLTYLLRRGQFDRELEQEIQFHIETRADEIEWTGVSREDAIEQARREFGCVARAGEETRAAWQFNWLEDLARDLRYGLRTLRRSPGFAVAAILSLAFGIGANTTVFSMVKAVLLSSLPVRQPERLVSFQQGGGAARLSYPDFEDYRTQVSAFEDVAAAYPAVPRSLRETGEPQRLWGQLVTTNYFTVLGAEPRMGRGFLAEENQAAVVVIADALWLREFRGAPDIIGRSIELGGKPYVVVGVAPPHFSGSLRGLETSFWIPLGLYPQTVLQLGQGARGPLEEDRNYHWLYLTARLKPSVSRASAQAALEIVERRLDKSFPNGDAKRSLRLAPADALAAALDQAQALLATLMVVVGLVLLVACANVANLLLARAAARKQEMGVRLAIGAGRARLVHQLLTESVLLAMCGAAAGIALAWIATHFIGKIESALPYPIALDLSTDWRVLLFTAALAAGTGILFGLAPALKSTRDTARLLAAPRFGLKNVLVVSQIAVSLVLLVAAGLFLQSLRKSASIPLGMDTRHVLLVSFDPRAAGYTNDKAERLFGRLLERVRALPGVASASLVDTAPLSFLPGAAGVSRPDQTTPVVADIYGVTSQYFQTLDIPLERGRDFDTGRRNGLPPAVINEALAAQLFASDDPIGGVVNWEGMPHEVIAIARNAKSRTPTEAPRSQIFVSLEQEYRYFWGLSGVVLSVRATGESPALADPLRAQIRDLAPALPVFNVETMQQHVARALLVPRLCGALFGISGIIGLILAAVGLYGVMSYAVRQRTREIGIRMAIGARPVDVVRLLVRQGIWLTGIGLGIGLLVAFVVSRAASALLYGVSARDAATFVGVSVMLFVTAMVAVLLPAMRAAGMDALRSIRYE